MTTNGRPSRVKNHYDYWNKPPPEPSPRCLDWMQRIHDGWRPNRRVLGFGYDSNAEWMGIYIWEYLHVIVPLLNKLGPK